MTPRNLVDDEKRNALYQSLPSVSEVLLMPMCREFLKSYSRGQLVDAIRSTLADLRFEISSGDHTVPSIQNDIDQIPNAVARYLTLGAAYSLRPVINATGVILHTNLGRAPLSSGALRHVVEVAQDYCNLELDLDTGLRSHRDAHAEALLLRVLSQESSAVVEPDGYGVVVINNCAAATLLALNSVAEKSEVIVSRGELVEIGGGFRIPEILEKSGAILKEVGTTNRTRIADYENALSAATGLLLRVHQSNFSMEGFVERPSLQEMVTLSKRVKLPLFEDQGTGLLSSLERVGVRGEPTLMQSFESGVDLIAASGDKLLGGPQCGILVGRRDLIERIRKNPLLRALRVDKLTYAALEATLLEHLSDASATIPVERMLSIPSEEIMCRCRVVVNKTMSARIVLDVVPVNSLVGGGTAPKASLPSCAISIRHSVLSASDLLGALRRLEPPIIGRIEEDVVLLDLRTVPSSFDGDLSSLLSSL
ncbi:L-seryl-tRNA(Sec) selenium transferase [Telmatobacter sp. DSM 110680]|uniref:L-seryl-tRNA(Sec) selenium transferase n=1 Tax=Telmatobacter sp. DSM 110680 TaxID=3036704 RepID=A0AAU7DNL3_9BACT